ncbi:hypothetical protein RYX36_020522 [Vicia faba]
MRRITRNNREEDGLQVAPCGRRKPQAEVTPYRRRQPDHDDEEGILKVDGSLRGGKTGCGGYLSNVSQEWICGFAQKLDPTTIVSDTERLEILKGLIWAREKGKRKVVVLSDNEGVVNFVGGAKDDKVRRQIRFLLDNTDWEVELNMIPGDQNKVTDMLADIAHELPSFNLCEIGSPPPKCARLLKLLSVLINVMMFLICDWLYSTQFLLVLLFNFLPTFLFKSLERSM